MDTRSRYVLNIFRHLYQVPDEVEIFYGDDQSPNTKGVFVPNHAGDFFEDRNQVDPATLTFREWKNTEVPFLFEQTAEADFFTRQSDAIRFSYDIIGASFYFLSGWQEYVSPKRDEYGRYPYRQSLQFKLGAPHIPFVNYYFDILKTAIEQVYSVELAPRKIESHPYTFILTHDIDSVYSGWLQDGYSALKSGKPGRLISILLQKMKGDDPWFNLGEIIAFEKKRGVDSTFFFLARQGTHQGIKHADYSLEDPAIPQLMDQVRNAGAEIGLHGDVEAHRSPAALKRSINRCGPTIKGNRFHFLMFDVRKTPGILSSCGLEYDSTLGFSEHVGFRNGICHPFPLYDLENNRPTTVLEIPLAVMDVTLHNAKYMGLPPEQAFSGIEPVIRELHKFNGAVSILWHNNYFSDLKYHGWKDVLDEVFTRARTDEALITKAETVLQTFNFSSR
ncbi:polysaccharide deacetylase family protein [Halalkalibaculum sp. DA3122]|uniref:polysaccharide deacetylase family protein n=1 Tax=Halalkalibaculum sp. DA3122 TaxID=3373607 RepID=UPI0037541C0E